MTEGEGGEEGSEEGEAEQQNERERMMDGQNVVKWRGRLSTDG